MANEEYSAVSGIRKRDPSLQNWPITDKEAISLREMFHGVPRSLVDVESSYAWVEVQLLTLLRYKPDVTNDE